mmetsp:Transcript_23474/g.30497  ORF Transcript_23474/g.30497 Transcript_23474/m.30497 type:complete len:713 (+) Transcript_23474:23-2161(+)
MELEKVSIMSEDLDEEKGPVTVEEEKNSGFRVALGDAPSTLSPGLEEGSQNESVVNFGTIRTTHSVMDAVIEEEEAEQEKALAAFASNLREENSTFSKNKLDETPIQKINNDDLRLMNELQKDNERLAASLQAAIEKQKLAEESVKSQKEKLEMELKEAKTELQLLSASVSSSFVRNSNEKPDIQNSTETSLRLRQELALASERDELRAELEATKQQARQAHRDLITQLNNTQEALQRANQKKQDLEFQLIEVTKRSQSDDHHQHRVAELEKRISAQHEIKQEANMWEERCAQLEQELEIQRQEHETRIENLRKEFRALRAAHDKHKLQLSSSVATLPTINNNAEISKLKLNVKDLESQLEAARQFWAPKLEYEQRKIKHLENELAKKKNLRSDHSQDRDLRIRGLQVEIERLVEINSNLERENAEKKMPQTKTLSKSIQTIIVEPKLQQENLEPLQVSSAALGACREATLKALGAALTASQALRCDLEQQGQILNNQITIISKKLEESQSLALRAGQEAAECRRRAQEAETPPQVAVAALAAQVNDLERKQRDRKLETERAIQQAKTHAQLEISRIEARHRDELAAKDQQLARFRLELDKLLDALRLELSNRGTRRPGTTRAPVGNTSKKKPQYLPKKSPTSNASTPSDPGYNQYLQSALHPDAKYIANMRSLAFDDRPPAYDQINVPAVSPADDHQFSSFPPEPPSSITT